MVKALRARAGKFLQLAHTGCDEMRDVYRGRRHGIEQTEWHTS